MTKTSFNRIRSRRSSPPLLLRARGGAHPSLPELKTSVLDHITGYLERKVKSTLHSVGSQWLNQKKEDAKDWLFPRLSAKNKRPRPKDYMTNEVYMKEVDKDYVDEEAVLTRTKRMKTIKRSDPIPIPKPVKEEENESETLWAPYWQTPPPSPPYSSVTRERRGGYSYPIDPTLTLEKEEDIEEDDEGVEFMDPFYSARRLNALVEETVVQL